MRRIQQTFHMHKSGVMAISSILVVLIMTACSLSTAFIPQTGSSNNTANPVAQVSATSTPARAEPTRTQVTLQASTAVPGGNLPDRQGMAGQNDLVDLYQQANPGVVNIRVTVDNGFQSGVGTGSGWVYDQQNGLIVTNHHVVENSDNLVVTFFNGFQEAAQVIGTDPYSDLAVIQVMSLPQEVHALQLGNSDDIQVGEWVAAIGSPFGLGATMTTGIVSALGRDIPGLVTNYSIPQAIQTDAAINPGNSGGPLLDMAGNVIGINAQIATGGSGNQGSGVGFAIPINIVKLVVPSLAETGSYTWPYLGVSGTSVDLYVQQANNLQTQRGAYIHQVVQGGPAEQAGLQGSTGQSRVSGFAIPTGGDVITGFNGQEVNTYEDLLALISLQKPDDMVSLTFLRDGQQQQIQVTLGARPSSQQSTGFSQPPTQ